MNTNQTILNLTRAYLNLSEKLKTERRINQINIKRFLELIKKNKNKIDELEYKIKDLAKKQNKLAGSEYDPYEDLKKFQKEAERLDCDSYEEEYECDPYEEQMYDRDKSPEREDFEKGFYKGLE